MNNKPFLSFVIPCFHSGKTIQRAIDSIVDQFDSYSSYEIIISCLDENDTTMDLIKIPRGVNLKVVFSREPGVTANRNKGLLESKGDYIYFLDSDDVLYKNKKNSFINLVENFPDVDMFFGRIVFFNDGCLQFLDDYPQIFNDLINLDRFYSDERIISYSYCSYLFKRSFLINNNCFIENNIVNSEDLYFIGLALTKKPTLFLTKYIFSIYSISNCSLSKDCSLPSALSWINSFNHLNKILEDNMFSNSLVRIRRFFIQNRLDIGIHLNNSDKNLYIDCLKRNHIKKRLLLKRNGLKKKFVYLLFGYKITWYIIKKIRHIF